VRKQLLMNVFKCTVRYVYTVGYNAGKKPSQKELAHNINSNRLSTCRLRRVSVSRPNLHHKSYTARHGCVPSRNTNRK